MGWNLNKTIHIIDKEEDFLAAMDYLSQFRLLALDTETNGLKRFRRLVGLSFATDEDQGFYIPILSYKGTEEGLQPFWSNPDLIYNTLLEFFKQNRQYIFHNAQFDIGTINNHFNILLLDKVHCDTMLLAHTVHNEEPPHGLKPLATILLDPLAANPQEDVKENVKAKGGNTTKTNFDMYMCDYQILGKYAAMDTIYTYGLYNKLYPEIDKQELRELWEEEVLALLPVIYDLNHYGIRIDVPYFEKLKQEMLDKVSTIEDEIYEQIRDKVDNYEMERIAKEIKIGKQSEFGKKLITEGKASYEKETKEFKILVDIKEDLKNFYCNKKESKRVFNFDSGDDKAYLIYNILGFESKKETATGKKSVDASTLESLGTKSPIIKMLLDRSGEQKLLNTYVTPLLDNHINGIIYTGFRQTGTISGRLSSGEPINLQTAPRDDLRIKKGFIPREGCVFIGDDYSQLEPRVFAFISGETNLMKVFSSGEDFYSRIAIDVLGIKNASAREEDKNYLKKINPQARHIAKQFCLAVPYGAEGGRVAQMLNISYEEGNKLVNKYLDKYPNLRKWMMLTDLKVKTKGEARTIAGRKRRLNLPAILNNKYKIDPFSKREITSLFTNEGDIIEGYDDPIKLYLDCRNARNNGKNFQIQGLAGSVTNAAAIEFYKKACKGNIRILLNVHDELVIECPKEVSKTMSELLKMSMENNRITKLISVPMHAEPIVTDKSLAEAK